MGPSSLEPAPWVVLTPDGFEKVCPDEETALLLADGIPGAIASEAYPEEAALFRATQPTNSDPRAEA